MNARLVPVVLLAASMVLVSCNKGQMFAPELGDDGDLLSFFENNVENARQHFQVDAASGGDITGAKGVNVVFGANAFVDANGNVVSGPVDVSLVEVMTLADMIWLNKQTVGYDAVTGTRRMLRSGGALQVTASQGGQPLGLGPDGMIVRVPTAQVDPNMAVFTADGMAEDQMIWNLSDSTVLDTSSGTWGGQYVFYYQLQAQNLNWINCDYFAYYPNTTNITAVLPADVHPDSTLVWIGFPTENAVMGMWEQNPSIFSTWQVVPVGMPATVIALTRDGADYRSAIVPLTIASGMSVGLTFQSTTLQAFETALDGL